MGVKSFCLLLFALLLVTSYCFNFCEVQSPEIKVFTTHQQIQKIPLDKHIRGYNLDFTTSDQTVVSVFQPYHIADKGQVTIKSGYSLVNVDGRNSNTNLWSRQGILFAQGGEKNVSIGYGQFASGVLPKIESYNYVELPYASLCYSGLISSQNLDVVIDCQKQTAQKSQMSDLLCVISKDGKSNCKDFSSITKTSKRSSFILNLGTQKFLLSSTLTGHISAQFKNQTFINVYHILDSNIEFNMIIDRRTLGLKSLSITDIDLLQINGEDYVILSDANSRLIAFKYTLGNTVQDIMVIPVNGMPQQFQLSAEGTWLIAVQKYILQCNFLQSSTSLQEIRKYELDLSDNIVTDLQSSYLFVTVRTAQGHLYTFDRKYTELKYLLNREDINEHTIYVVSPFYPRLFQINSTSMVSVAISSGYLFVSQVQESKDIVIKGNSGSTSCVFNFRIEFISNASSKIYIKHNMTSAYRLESMEPAKFLLSDYFGGSNLKYNVIASKDLGYNLEHINSYKQTMPTNSNAEILFTTVVDVDAKSYWIIQFSTQDARFYKCSLKFGSVSCTQNEKERFNSRGLTFNNADGKYRKDGRALVSWTFSDSNWMYFKYLGEPGLKFIAAEPYTRFSQVIVGQRYTIFVEKELNRVTFYDNTNIFIFTKGSFTKDQLNAMGGGFYPREVSMSHRNQHIFYIKSPISIITVSYEGGKELEILAYNKISDTFIPDDLWSITVGKQSLLLFTPDQVAEYAVLADASISKLHKISLERKPLFPIRYQVETDTAYFECQDSTIQYIRLNQPALDSQYYNVGLKKNNGGGDWDVSGSWLVTPNQAYFQFLQPSIVIISYVPDTLYREDLTLSITVSSDNEKKEVVANVTALNYPVPIQSSSEVDNGIILPEKGENNLIPFPVDKFFVGSVADYRIICPYCLNEMLTLVPPIRKINENTDIKNFSALIGLEDNSGAIVVEQNKVKLLDTNNRVLSEKVIESGGECSTLGVNEGNLIVFCVGTTNQEIVLYTVTHNDLVYVQTYIIPAQRLIMKPSEINVYRKGNSNKLTVFIHDVDLMNPTAKNSNIKVFEISQTIQFKSQIDSSTFKLLNSEAINSMSIHKNHMFVTIGGLGVGYVDVSNYAVGQFINLESQPALKNYTLDKTTYLRVIIHDDNEDKNSIKALVSTSNSYNYLLGFKITDAGVVSFDKIVQTYQRYGHQQCINWALIDDKFVMLAFYNASTSVQTLALYKRGNKGIVDFFTSIHSTVPLTGLNIPKAALLHSQNFSESSSFFYIKNDTRPGSPPSLSLYNVTQQFNLLANYDKPSAFEIIQVTAYNDYYSVTRDMKCEFEGGAGVKWYSIMIVCILVGIAVGVSFGFYLKMKKRKADSKKVSLFTENEEVDEQI